MAGSDKSNSELIANLNQSVTNVENRVHELTDAANKVPALQAERDELADAMDQATLRLTVLLES